MSPRFVIGCQDDPGPPLRITGNRLPVIHVTQGVASFHKK